MGILSTLMRSWFYFKIKDSRGKQKTVLFNWIVSFLWFVTIIIHLIIIWIESSSGPFVEYSSTIVPVEITTLIILIIIPVLFVINNYKSRTYSSMILVFVLLLLIFLSETVVRIIEGQVMVYCILVIILSGLLIKASMAVIITILSLIIMISFAISYGMKLNFIAIFAFCLVGWVTWLSTFLFEKSMKNARERNLRMNEMVGQRNFYKDLFTHDMSNILQNLIGIFDIVFGETMSDDCIHLQQLAGEQLEKAKWVVNNVQNLAILTDQQVKEGACDINALTCEIVGKLRDSFHQEDVIIDVDVNKQEKKAFLVKSNKFLGSCINNLILNSIIHNDQKPKRILINIYSEIENNVDDNHFVVIEIIDNGVGIPLDVISHLEKNKINIGAKESKIRLGLHLVNIVLKKIGGKIQANRLENDTGTRIVLKLPRA